MNQAPRAQQVLRVAGASLATLVGGTIGFHSTLSEGWFSVLLPCGRHDDPRRPRHIPQSDGARVVSIVLVLCGLTIIAYAGAVIVESIAGGVLTGAPADRRRERKIERLRDHIIICGYGRVGRVPAVRWRTSC